MGTFQLSLIAFDGTLGQISWVRDFKDGIDFCTSRNMKIEQSVEQGDFESRPRASSSVKLASGMLNSASQAFRGSLSRSGGRNSLTSHSSSRRRKSRDYVMSLGRNKQGTSQHAGGNGNDQGDSGSGRTSTRDQLQVGGRSGRTMIL